MTLVNCNCKCRCPLVAIILSAIIGVLTAFFQITGAITVTTTFLWVVFGIAVVYLAALVIASVLGRGTEGGCKCAALNTLLVGIVGAVLTAVALIAFGIVATSVISAILVGLLLFFFTLIITATACLVRTLSDCAA